MHAEYGETIFYTTWWLLDGMSLSESIENFVLRAPILASKVSETLGNAIGVAFYCMLKLHYQAFPRKFHKDSRLC